jgi:tetratricopeptide (TPR) repeat protein
MMLLACTAFAKDTPSNPPEPSIYELMSQAREHVTRAHWQQAIDELTQIIAIEPNNADAHNLLGYSHRLNTPPNLTQSFKHYRQALAINPNHRGAHEYIGRAYLQENQIDNAKKHLSILETICKNRSCPEYTSLANAIENLTSNANNPKGNW